MTRPLTIVGNWKMYKTRAETFSFISALTPRLRPHDRVWIAPSFPALAEAVALKGDVLKIGAQNMHEAQEGAFTGEVSARMLKDCGVDFVLCGHSERRSLFHEGDELIAKKVSAALLEGITPILCIGETEQQRVEGKTEAILTMQLEKGLAEVEDLTQVIIAYEPVWAIGTGKSATASLAQEAHALCRAFLRKKYGAAAEKVSILYGGSVKPENSEELLREPDIDGALIGGASLSVASFATIIETVRGIS